MQTSDLDQKLSCINIEFQFGKFNIVQVFTRSGCGTIVPYLFSERFWLKNNSIKFRRNSRKFHRPTKTYSQDQSSSSFAEFGRKSVFFSNHLFHRLTSLLILHLFSRHFICPILPPSHRRLIALFSTTNSALYLLFSRENFSKRSLPNWD